MALTNPTVTMLMPVLFLILLTGLASAFTFTDEITMQDITSFSWCFKPFSTDTISSKEDWQPYVNNINCKDVTYTLFAEIPAQVPVQYCDAVPDKCVTEKKEVILDNKTLESVVKDVETCTAQPCVERTEWEWQNEYYDITKDDYLIQKANRICLRATRKAQTGITSCDMNFKYFPENS